MIDEFYHKDIFGQVVDLNLAGSTEKEINTLSSNFNKQGWGFNIFTLTDAVGSRQKKQAWIIYRQALILGISAEEVFYKLVWQVKSMLVVSKTKSVDETDMKLFSYNKAKNFLTNFKSGELEYLSENLVVGYCLARRGEGELETFIEKILLNL